MSGQPGNCTCSGGDADSVHVDAQYLSQVEGMPGVKVIKGLPRMANTVGIMNFNIVTEGNPDVHSGKLDGKGVPSDFLAISMQKGFQLRCHMIIFIKEAVQEGDKRPEAQSLHNYSVLTRIPLSII